MAQNESTSALGVGAVAVVDSSWRGTGKVESDSDKGDTGGEGKKSGISGWGVGAKVGDWGIGESGWGGAGKVKVDVSGWGVGGKVVGDSG